MSGSSAKQKRRAAADTIEDDAIPTRAFLTAYQAFAAFIVIGAVATGLLALAEKQPLPNLPLEMRLTRTSLSHKPVTIENVVSCSCWDGPRQQAQRKYKFTLINNGADVLRIGGGTRSEIRLLVAYPGKRPPAKLTLPDPRTVTRQGRFATPSDIDLNVADKAKVVSPNHIVGANETFDVPPSYSVWGLPPVDNKLVEIVSDDGSGGSEGTYATVADKTELLPHESYGSDRVGHGSWTFYLPLTPQLAKSRADLAGVGLETASRDSAIEDQIIFIGVALLRPKGKHVGDLLGFAPAPSDASLLDPSAF